MNQDQPPETKFARRLRAELKAIVAARGAAAEAELAAASPPAPRRRRHRLALAGAGAAVGVAAVLLLSAGGNDTPAAFAVEPQDGGGVTIAVNSPEDAPGLEAALAEAGIRSQVTWLAAGMECREPRYTPSTARSALGGRIGGMNVAGPGPAMTIGVMSAEQLRDLRRQANRGEISGTELLAASGNITLDPTSLRPDQTVVISGAPGPSPDLSVIVNGPTEPYEVDPEGGYEAHFAIAEGPVEPCEPIPVANGGALGEMNRVIAEEAAEAGIEGEGSGDASGASADAE
jgi:hypothetical protein